MTPVFDLTVMPLVREAGQDLGELPGLYVADPPRRAARGRGQDRLILFLSMAGNAPLTPGKQTQVLEQLAKAYFDAPGSVTNGMRSVAEALNNSLYERNTHNSGSFTLGRLVLAVLREDQLFLAVSGGLHVFLITAEGARDTYDPDMEGRGLGQGKVPPLNFTQIHLQSNDTLLLSAEPPAGWTVTGLSGIYGQGPEGIRRRLLNQNAINLSAALIQVKAGKGQTYWLRTRSAQRTALPEMNGEKLIFPVSEPPAPPAAPTIPVAVAPRPAPVQAAVRSPAPAARPAAETIQPSQRAAPAAEAASRPIPPALPTAAAAPTPQPAEPRKPRPNPFVVLAGVFRPVGAFFSQIGRLLVKFLTRLLPGESFSMPTSTMALIALAVPIVVVAAATVVYLEKGVSVQAQQLIQHAMQAEQQSETQTDPLARRNSLQTALGYLDQADAIAVMPETQNLRAKIFTALDDLELARRADYKPAIINGLPMSVQITRLLYTRGDLYMLDAVTGSVLHAVGTASGFQLDPAFDCGPGVPSKIGPLVSVIPWPSENSPKAAVLAMDANASLMFCSPGATPQTHQLAPPPALGLIDLKGMAFDLGNLYVLDPKSNAVWIYWNSKFDEEPQFFFGDQVPPMQNVADLAVNHDELYLLQADGSMTICYYSALTVSPTRCGGVNYVDYRPGHENTPLKLSHPFKQVFYSEPPDPSLFLLEAQSQAIYHFSLRNLTFQRQYLPKYGAVTAGPATAFTVSSTDRLLFLAVGHDVYYANIP